MTLPLCFGYVLERMPLLLLTTLMQEEKVRCVYWMLGRWLGATIYTCFRMMLIGCSLYLIL